MRHRTLLLAASGAGLAAVSAPAAQAQPATGLYLGGAAGANHRQDSGDRTLTVETGWGFAGVLGLGWDFGNGLRAEVEGNLRGGEVDGVRGLGLRESNPSGRVRSTGTMANLLYDVGATMGWPVHLTLGGGAGYVWQVHDRVGARFSTGTDSFAARLDDVRGAFAYQAIAGLSVPVAPVPGLALTAEYRFLGTLPTEIDGHATAEGRGVLWDSGRSPASRGLRHEADNLNHAVLLGLRYSFGQAARGPAAAAAAVPPAQAGEPRPPTRAYVVFFDWDRADLTSQARRVVAEAARNGARAGPTRIEVAGHADRSGTPQHNRRLSERRAEAVAAELVRNGVGRGEIGIVAFGESRRPLAPTADGARDHRRVEVVLR
jgi:OOP family OmpA-OmpF porin